MFVSAAIDYTVSSNQQSDSQMGFLCVSFFPSDDSVATRWMTGNHKLVRRRVANLIGPVGFAGSSLHRGPFYCCIRHVTVVSLAIKCNEFDGQGYLIEFNHPLAQLPAKKKLTTPTKNRYRTHLCSMEWLLISYLPTNIIIGILDKNDLEHSKLQD